MMAAVVVQSGMVTVVGKCKDAAADPLQVMQATECRVIVD